ncbi:MAG: sulfite exporter TauE/SafE family protein [Oscillatoriales cyanobacterium SM2_2_1]|nr:sulfite exporter TauE/SafE family protein [Oscillatoriales cyanobacterium SM2_2_1]
MEIVGYALAIAIGLSLGLLGGGGSVLALPVLVYVMGIEPKTAIAMTLVIVGTVSLLGVIPHARRGNLDLPRAAIFGTATMVGAYLGARLAGLPFMTSGRQMLIFAGAMLLAAGLMIYRTSRSPKQELFSTPTEDPLASPQYTKPLCRFCWLWLLTEGMGVGVLTGLVGVGGGFAIVPALVLLAKVPMRKAIGTSLLIIAANAIAGFVGYLGAVEFNWPLTVTFTFLAGIGTVLGSYGSRYVSVVHLQKSFGYFLLAVAALVLVQQYGRAESRPQPNRQGTRAVHSAPLFRLS